MAIDDREMRWCDASDTAPRWLGRQFYTCSKHRLLIWMCVWNGICFLFSCHNCAAQLSTRLRWNIACLSTCGCISNLWGMNADLRVGHDRCTCFNHTNIILMKICAHKLLTFLIHRKWQQPEQFRLKSTKTDSIRLARTPLIKTSDHDHCAPFNFPYYNLKRIVFYFLKNNKTNV